VPSSARFKIVIDKLHCKDETFPAFIGSDEISFTFLATGFMKDGSFLELKRVRSDREDVDSGDTFDLNRVLLAPQDQNTPMPLIGITTVVMGYEVDNWEDYALQVQSFWDAFVLEMGLAWKFMVANAAADVLLAIIFATPGPLLGIVIGGILFTALAAIFALWGPADLIAQDAFALSMVDLFMLTNGNFPSPPSRSYITDQGIKVDVEAVSKGENDYVERRKYRCDDEDSEYHLTLHYTREQ